MSLFNVLVSKTTLIALITLIVSWTVLSRKSSKNLHCYHLIRFTTLMTLNSSRTVQSRKSSTSLHRYPRHQHSLGGLLGSCHGYHGHVCVRLSSFFVRLGRNTCSKDHGSNIRIALFTRAWSHKRTHELTIIWILFGFFGIYLHL